MLSNTELVDLSTQPGSHLVMWNRAWASPVSHPLPRAIRYWSSPNTITDQSSDPWSTVKSEWSSYHHSSPDTSISSLRIC